ncbi:MAG: prepilin-type N-terminal cleavage/methylation domain-containing protein [Nitrospira sp.]|nr:prepilin-type N-terminal cleavage/methylation domain-containing protein [Nitrospira sp.]
MEKTMIADNLRTRRQPSGERGFTLLEGMIASAILSTGLLALAAMQGMAITSNVDANDLTRVTTVATDILERMQFNRKNASAYNGINTGNTTPCGAITQPQARGDCLLWSSAVSATNFDSIQATVTVSDVAPAVLAQKSVTVTLTWVARQNAGSYIKRNRALTVNRIIAQE